MHSPFTIWTNAEFPKNVAAELESRLSPHRLVYASELSSLNLTGSGADPLLNQADIAFGQPLPDQVIQLQQLRWIHLTSAGYTPYDRQEVRSALQTRGAALTNSSGVYDAPCAQHVLAMMLAFARGLPDSLAIQLGDRSWPATERRSRSFLLDGQTALLCGFGEIAIELCRLLSPFGMKLLGVRRHVRGDEPIETIPMERIDDYLPIADHVINLLPANESTANFFDAKRLGLVRPNAYFYNIGRGSTVNQDALAHVLSTNSISAAYLDVMTPEPLPPEHLLWKLPNCYITPHTAGGHRDEMSQLVEHFLKNLTRFCEGKPLLNRVM